jgi:hypothetical protein
MSYIQHFLEQHLSQFYLASLQTHRNDEPFFDFTCESNIFALSVDLLLFAEKGLSLK